MHSIQDIEKRKKKKKSNNSNDKVTVNQIHKKLKQRGLIKIWWVTQIDFDICFTWLVFQILFQSLTTNFKCDISLDNLEMLMTYAMLQMHAKEINDA